MMEGLRKSPAKSWIELIMIVLAVLMGINIYLFFHISNSSSNTDNNLYVIDNPDQKIKDIENYLDSISTSYLADEQFLMNKNHWISWGCGPSSYALAKIINKKFFDDKLTISASYNSKSQYEIVERFGLAQKEATIIDHGWLEIYLKDQFLFIDPTIGQFGKINKIAYQVFTVGQPDLQDILEKEYGIKDVRLSILVPKVINRIPKSQEPYPGMTIDESAIGYFLKALEDRNSVNDGVEPAEWHSWVSFLTNKYLN